MRSANEQSETTFLQRVVVVLACLLALCIAALAVAQQPPAPAPAAPDPIYPFDKKSGLADFNATCLYCRGFAQELRMYQDALISLRAEFAKRTAAMRAVTDAGLAGTVTPEQRAQWKRDGEAAEKLETAIKDMEAAEARAKATLEACILKYCPPPPTGGTLFGTGKVIEPPQGQDVPYPATPFPSDKPLEPPRGQLPGSGQPPAPLQQQPPGPQQPPAPPKPAEPKPGEGGLMGPTYIIEPDGSRTYLPPPGPPEQWPGIRAECPACKEAEAAVRAAFERRDAAQRKVDDLIRQRGKVVDEYLANILTSSEQQRRMAPIAKALEAAQKELQDRAIEITSYLYNLDQCNKERCRGPAEEDPMRRLLVPGGVPPGPVKPVIPGDAPPIDVLTPGAPPVGVLTPGAPPVGGPPPAPPPFGVPPPKKPPTGTRRPATPPGGIDAPPIDDMPPAADFPFVGPDMQGPPSLGTPPPQGPLSPAPGTPVTPLSLGSPCDCDALMVRATDTADMALVEERAMREAKAREKNAADAAVGMLVSLHRADPSAREAQLVQHPDYKDLKSKELEAKQDGDRARKYAQELRVAAEELFTKYSDCLKKCVADPTPQLRTVINLGGNAPFGRDPMGGTLVFLPPGNPGSPGRLQFSNANYGGGEGGAVLITVVRSGGSRGPASVSYQTSGGNATPGADYQPVSGTLTWSDGDDSPKSFSIALTNDTQVEGVETFNVSLSLFTGASPGSPLIAVVSIADDDSTSPSPAGSLQFSTSQYQATEGGGGALIFVFRVNGSSGIVSVQYFTGPGSATAGADYQAVSGALTWGDGEVGTKSFTVPIIDDTLTEPTETFFVTLNNPTGGATLGAPATATVSIVDNDVSTPVGPCGSLGNAWQSNVGGPYTCSGSCQPIPSSPFVNVNGDIVTITPFHAGGAATFQGCGTAINSQSNNMTFFGQTGHSATVNRESNTSFLANIRSSSGGSCDFRCMRPPPVR